MPVGNWDDVGEGQCVSVVVMTSSNNPEAACTCLAAERVCPAQHGKPCQ